MDVCTILFTAAVNIVEKLIYDWIKEEKTKISAKEIETATDKAIIITAKKQNLDTKQLKVATKRVVDEVIDRVPGIENTGLITKGLSLDCGTSEKSKQMIRNLEKVLDEIEAEYKQQSISDISTHKNDTECFQKRVILDIGKAPHEMRRTEYFRYNKEGLVPSKATDDLSYSRKMLEELKMRIAESENPRK